jgi:hypothetical protein
VRVRGPNPDPEWWQQLVAVVEVRARAGGLLLSITAPPLQRRQRPDQPQKHAEAAAAALPLAELRSIWAVVATHNTRTAAATSAQQWRVLLQLAGTHGATAAGTL